MEAPAWKPSSELFYLGFKCLFCGEVETIAHCFTFCLAFFDSWFGKWGEVFSLWVFIFGFNRKTQKHKCQLLNFILGQSKMAAEEGTRKVEDSLDCDAVLLLGRTIKARVMIDFNYYCQVYDLEPFLLTWTLDDVLCAVPEHNINNLF